MISYADGQSLSKCHQKAVIAASHGVDRLGRQVDEFSRQLDKTEVRLLEVGGGPSGPSGG